MHNGKASWDGQAAEAASVKWTVEFASSPTVTRHGVFQIASGDSAVEVARKLSAEWNSKPLNRQYPAMPQGATVVFGSTKPNNEIVGMRFVVLGGTKDRIPAAGAEVEVVNGLFVYRSA